MTHIVEHNGKKIHVYDNGHFISQRLDVGEGWEQEQIDYIKSEFSGPKKVMVDIGGDIGTYTIFLADSFEHVYCFEPNLPHYELIVKSIDLNDIKNVHVKHVACSDERGRCRMTTVHNNQVDIGDGDILVVKMDDYYYDRVDFLKIDVEGHEYKVLQGMKRIIEYFKPVIYLETHPSIVSDSQINSERFLTDLGYSVIKEVDELNKFWKYNV